LEISPYLDLVVFRGIRTPLFLAFVLMVGSITFLPAFNCTTRRELVLTVRLHITLYLGDKETSAFARRVANTFPPHYFPTD
jgi:hypothetical protein